MRQPVQRLCADADTLYYASGSIIKSYSPADGSSREIWRGGLLTDTDKLKSFSSRAIIALAVQNGVLASVGEDKMLRVFDLKSGKLESERETTKRPSCVIFADDRDVLVADKFGDVYSFPIHGQSSSFEPRVTNLPKTKEQRKADKKARREQKDQETKEEEGDKADDKEDEEEPVKDSAGQLHLPILGHVSILTDMLVSDGRIITADRDEHIRVSQYSKAYIVDNFLLAHEAFVTSLLLVGDVLISGGGDDFLAVWDWRQGKLLGQISLEEPMAMAKCEVPTVAKLEHGEDSLFMQLEGIAGIFVLALATDVLGSSGWRRVGSDVYLDFAVSRSTLYCSRVEGPPLEAWQIDGTIHSVESLNQAADMQVESIDFNIPVRSDMRKRTFDEKRRTEDEAVKDSKRRSDEDLTGDDKRVK
ncbi:WD40-repeat-containing domain protein [Protomyces lactucae-debilis]|uniref:WD40-repeat-containing domain protein n=1 Tax=Protomyces lactucae-debilis TaxID=2754530 RepID=A0A1Y2FDL9_PROLT|nr:WD40-repeat-containing domain protein [Protomyces lactucae-debilis]ORY82011.1 WD40-repeat-containing domain protein [Protomyces lactucae-debilis]